jgi:hypothetical protein
MAAVLAAAGARAVEIQFVESLTSAQLARAGIAKLAPAQAAYLDSLVSRDVTSAQEGGVTGFSTTFTERHNAAERVACGLDRLSPTQRTAFNTFVAQAIALGPPPDQAFMYSPKKAGAAAPPPPPPTSLVTAPQRLEVHGDVSMTVGGGRGGSFYGMSGDISITDPVHNFTISAGYSEYKGKGFLPLCDLYPPFEPFGPYPSPYLGW